MLVGDRNRRVSGKWRLPSEKFVEKHARGVQITAGINYFTPCLLRRKVLRSAHDGQCRGHGGGVVVERSRDTKVHDLDVTGARQHHICRLNVTMDDAVSMGVIECIECATDDLE